MNKHITTVYIGIALLIIAIVFFVLNKVSENELILSVASYGRFIGMFGGALLGIGLYRKYKGEEK